MKYTAVQLMKRMAAEHFKLGNLQFDGFDKIDTTEVTDSTEYGEELQAQLDIWADFRLTYTGTPPESYRVLNSMVMDYVDEHEEEFKAAINPQIVAFVKSQYQDVDLSEVDDKVDDFIWEDQVDYMIEIDEDNNEILFTLELVMDVEETEPEEKF